MNQSATTDLSVYDNAKHWVAQYESVDDVKEFIDKAAALQEYFRRANDFEMEKKAARARVRAERRAGELLRDMEKQSGARGLSGPGRGKKNGVVKRDPVLADTPKTLKDMGITKDQSSKYQKLAAIPDEKFEEALERTTDLAGGMGRVTTNSVLKSQEPKSPQPKFNEDALWVWGRLREFEKRIIQLDPKKFPDLMDEVMLKDFREWAPKVANWLRATL